MNSSDTIRHAGIVRMVKDDLVRVDLQVQSACSTCHAKSACSLGNTELKIVDIPLGPGEAGRFHPGKTVNVTMQPSQGRKAVLFGYVFPAGILVGTLFAAMAVTDNEKLSALAALIVVVLYYLLLIPLRQRMQKMLRLTIEKS